MKKIKQLKWAIIYGCGALLQMGVVSVCVALLNLYYGDIGMVGKLSVLVLGGTSSAMWGIIVSVQSKRSVSVKKIFKEFFNVKQSPKYYGVIFIFLLILFGQQILMGQVLNNIKWYGFILFFLQAILFGGIEEIGWRYTYQPIVEEVISFEWASIVTFITWGIWHYMYFYIIESIHKVNHLTFLIGLLGSCFIMGAIYRVTRSLWLCVMYHALLNMLSQTLIPSSLIQTIGVNSLAILSAIAWTRYVQGSKQPKDSI